jgi:diguanylate cyclase (GGDEF)-like protein
MLKSIAVGGVQFGSDEELFQFRFRLLRVSLVVGVLFSGALVLANWWGLNDQGRVHSTVLEAFFLNNLLMTILLWGRRDRFAAVAWSFFATWFLVDLSALWFTPSNEFRTVWFMVEIAVAYTIFGTATGLFIAALSLLTIVGANRYLTVQFSNNAIVTMIFSFCAFSIFQHIHTKRFIDFHQRMTDANQRLRELSNRDPLTGVANRRCFLEQLEAELARYKRFGSPVAVLMLDIDWFKRVNDTHGHAMGDAVLRHLAELTKGRLRGIDLFGRLGGEEFGILLPGTDGPGAWQFADRFRRDVAETPIKSCAGTIPITISIGVAELAQGDATADGVLARADAALYRAKEGGRNRVEK